MDGKSSKASLIEARKKFLAAAERPGWAGAEGVVCALSGGGNNQIVEIAFDSGVMKKFAAAYAPITPLEE